MRRSKYGVRTDKAGKERRTVDGILFASQKEAKRYSELKLLIRAGQIIDLLLQKNYLLVANGVLICTYRADFVYVTKDGRTIVEDAKGFKTDVYKIKKRLMKALLGIDIQEV